MAKYTHEYSDTGWRSLTPTPEQIKLMYQYNIPYTALTTRGEAHDLLNASYKAAGN